LKTKIQMISIVDDDAAMGESIAELLLSIGLRTQVFTSAIDFLASEGIERTSCLIADIKMPGIGGLELHKRATARGYRFPVIFISAFENAGVRAAATKAGAIDLLTKPFSEEDLFKCIRNALPGSSGSA
jgi:FixJ family two-component response regulator